MALKEKVDNARESVLRSFENKYQKVETSWVKLMERLTKKFSRHTWYIALVIYAICGVSICTYIILTAIL
ncbi:hypothetical protein D3C87_129800 [compost metagenome]